MWETIRESIIEIRKHTDKGSININTNGSKPDAVAALCQAGLNSMRVSTNSAQKSIYEAYYRPNNYQFEDIIESLKVMRKHGGWTSINYFVFPGITDSEAEYEALRKLIKETGLNMIQWRNFNIDPDWYMGRMGMYETGEMLGIQQMMDLIREEFPDLKFGYFNPPIERIKGDYYTSYAGASQ
jgi:molybdenum cofactor biosynthesis enzyme MoaA